MTQFVHCECGVDLQGETEDEIVTKVEQHVQESHPEMASQVTREKILEMAHEH